MKLELNKIYCMECIEGMKQLDENSIDSIVTDPPYGLEFMGKDWDKQKNLQQFSFNWAKEAIRVLKPGGHMLVFGGTRTYHRMTCGIEDAGFQIRDCVQWIYGGGFPKSHNISKAIDKMEGVEREVVSTTISGGFKRMMITNKEGGFRPDDYYPEGNKFTSNEPITDLAKEWNGWGTALKPANEPIVVARKFLSEKTVALNILKWGTGGINIDDCRISLNGEKQPTGSAKRVYKSNQYTEDKIYGDNKQTPIQGRFPANIILDEKAGKMLDEQSGQLKSGNLTGKEPSNTTKEIYGTFSKRSLKTIGDKGGASRFFYCAKASKNERNTNLGDLKNNHPTVKPIKLMKYLVKLITPPNGIVLDPFIGSGTTAISCKELGRNFIGFETNQSYIDIATKRLGK